MADKFDRGKPPGGSEGKPRIFLDLERAQEKIDQELREKWDPNRRVKTDPKPSGRPAHDDESRLKAMARLIASGEIRGRGGIRSAAWRVAGQFPDPDQSATAERIRKKYAPRRDELESSMARELTFSAARQQVRQKAALARRDSRSPFSLNSTGSIEESIAGSLAEGERQELQNEVRIRCEVDPRFARYLRESGIRPQFVTLECLRSIFNGFSPKRRRRR